MFTIKGSNMLVWPMLGVTACAAVLAISSLKSETGGLDLGSDGGPIRAGVMPRSATSSHEFQARNTGIETLRYDAAGGLNRRVATPQSTYAMEEDGDGLEQPRRARANASNM